MVLQASPLTLDWNALVFKHHQVSLMSQRGGTSSAFRYKTDLLPLRGVTFVPSAAKAVE